MTPGRQDVASGPASGTELRAGYGADLRDRLRPGRSVWPGALATILAGSAGHSV